MIFVLYYTTAYLIITTLRYPVSQSDFKYALTGIYASVLNLHHKLEPNWILVEFMSDYVKFLNRFFNFFFKESIFILTAS